jgi:hypothetical protein
LHRLSENRLQYAVKAAQADPVEIIHTLRQIACVKG